MRRLPEAKLRGPETLRGRSRLRSERSQSPARLRSAFLALLLGVSLACAGPAGDEGGTGAGAAVEAEAASSSAPADVVDAVMAELAARPHAFSVTERHDGEVVRQGSLLVASAGGGETRYLLSWRTDPGLRVATDGETAFAGQPTGDVLFSPLERAGGILLGREAGKLVPAALNPASFTRYQVEPLPGDDSGLRSLRAPLPGGGGWELAVDADDLPRRVSVQASPEAAITELELVPIEEPVPADAAAYRLSPAGGGEMVEFYAGPAPGDAAPEATFELADGAAVELRELRGSAVVLDFWATWCVPCRPAMRELETLSQELGGEGLRVFGLRLYDSGDPTAYLEDLGITYPIGDGAPLEKPLAIDQYGLPSLYVIDRDGRVVDLLVGYDPELTPAALRRAVERALG